jgi:hypothetical protein
LSESTPQIEPDTKDWTWVLDRPCEECGFDASTFDRHELPRAFRNNAQVWLAVLADPGAARRPRPDQWSPLEYACHVHDVHHVFHERVTSMLHQDTPQFPNWDQDVSAVEHDYAGQLPSIVGPTLVAAAYAVGDLYASVPTFAWQRRGIRSNGSEFTVETIGRYHLHDVVHHLYDVRAAAQAATVRAYDDYASEYAAHQDMPPAVAAAIALFAGLLPEGSLVLEIGSAGGRDADALEDAGLVVRRTDIAPGFVRLLQQSGHPADVVDPLTDDLADPSAAPGTPYDGVWANASLLHVDRQDLPVVLGRLADATRAGGLLHLSVKQGDGDGWSIHGDVQAPRHFVYWREDALRAVLTGAGWTVEHLGENDSPRGEPWLEILATRT